eukprot:TRINITY_DN120216_c0_g1_i1.p2 TRINITY_DN120216_c0_g1~~TRINITY_DN120216_c0_g1_i1.p2  ORF type:complete len:353 (-),score=58.42 TRINITY_DN120216_c0_g1_i1:77-1021(-)
MELSPFTLQYWTYIFNLFYSFNGLIALSTTFIISCIIGYQLHNLFHSCADFSKSLHSQYEHWHQTWVLTKKSLALFHSRLVSLDYFLKILLIPVLAIFVGAFYSKDFRRHLLLFRGALFGAIMAIIAGMILMYRKYINYKIKKLKEQKEKYEAEKDLNINAVLGELTPSMKVGLREKLIVEAQAMLDKQTVELKRLDKEIDMYKFDLAQKLAMIKELNRFKWCNECIKKGESEAKKDKKLLFKCPNDCLKQYFEHCKKVYDEFGKKEKEVKHYKEEARRLEQEEKLIEVAKAEEIKAKHGKKERVKEGKEQPRQ